MSNIREPELPESIEVKRTDPVYMAHAYLTKVPVAAIVPFIEAFTEPGQLVLDPFAGSGSTLAAALAVGYDGVGVELDDAYVALARQAIPRLARLT